MAKVYRKDLVTEVELRSLTTLATTEEQRFFDRNSHLVPAYRNRLIAVALCQGAALHFLGRGYGVKDFDVHYFYAQNPAKRRLSRAVKKLVANVGTFSQVRVDFIRTVVPGAKPQPETKALIEHLRAFLQSKPTANASHLAEKAVIGLLPPELFGVTIWPASRIREPR